MNKDQKNKLFKYGLPIGALVLAFTAPATVIGATIDGGAGLTSDFNSAQAVPVPDNITIEAQASTQASLNDILNGSIKDAENKPVYLTLAA